MTARPLEAERVETVRRWPVSVSPEGLIAFPLLLLLLPLVVLIAAAIFLDDGGPIFFAQTRLGRNGRPFALLKFRKFAADCGTAGPAVTTNGDTRLTRVGRFLEQSKLDELPQLWNIVRGEMSLVGPRPESMFFAGCFSGVYSGLLRYRPGVFGPAQALFRNEKQMYPDGCDPEEFYRQVLFPMKARIDLAYYPTRSWLSDCAWIGRCCLAICGVSVGHGRLQRLLPEMASQARVDG